MFWMCVGLFLYVSFGFACFDLLISHPCVLGKECFPVLSYLSRESRIS